MYRPKKVGNPLKLTQDTQQVEIINPRYYRYTAREHITMLLYNSNDSINSYLWYIIAVYLLSQNSTEQLQEYAGYNEWVNLKSRIKTTGRKLFELIQIKSYLKKI